MIAASKKWKPLCHNCLSPEEIDAIAAGRFIFQQSTRAAKCVRCGSSTNMRVLPPLREQGQQKMAGAGVSSPRGRIQNSPRPRRSSPRPRPRALSKTRARPRHSGGRPPAFIPAAVVLRAAALYQKHRDFSRVLRELAQEGNGTWARNTLLRRISTGPVQNSPTSPASASSSSALQAASKTDRKEERLLDALEREAFGSSRYHTIQAQIHALGGPCGCYSCGTVKGRARG